MVTLVSSLGMAGAGIWNSGVEAVLAGTFSCPLDEVPPVPLPSPPLPPVPPPESAEVFLSSLLPEEFAYQTPPPMISATTTTAATMMAIWALNFPPPEPPWGACGCIGMVCCCG